MAKHYVAKYYTNSQANKCNEIQFVLLRTNAEEQNSNKQ